MRNATPRIEYLKVQNFRALRSVEFRNLTPVTVLLGPDGSGKSTVFDVFAFLAECFESGLRRAWDRRGRARELKTRNAEGAVTIELKYRERRDTTLTTYHLEVDERNGAPVVVREWLGWKRRRRGAPFHFLEYGHGSGQAASGEAPDAEDQRVAISLESPDLLAVNALGRFREHPRVAALRDFIMGWRVSCPSADGVRGQPEAGPQERLTRTGDNLANVLQYWSERHASRLDDVFETLNRRAPRIESVWADAMPDGRPSLQIEDAPFNHPVLERLASDGTLKMLAYLVLLHDPEPPPFIGLEEPENFLHPRLLPGLTEECRAACQRTQLFVTTHSPFFLDALRPREVRVLWRDEAGHAHAARVADLGNVPEFVREGAQPGDLWTEGQFGADDPLTPHDAPAHYIHGGGR